MAMHRRNPVAKYCQLTPDLARMALDNGVARELLIALEYVALAERLDAPYGEVKRAFTKLQRVKLSLDLDSLIGGLLAERARANRKRSKSNDLDHECHGTKEPGTKVKVKVKEKTKKEEEEEEKFGSSVPDEFTTELSEILAAARKRAGIKV